MYRDKELSKRFKQKSRKIRCYIVGALCASFLLLTIAAVGETAAWMVTQADPIENIFTPSKVTCEITEAFNGTTKSNVNVTNTGDTEAYIRVKLITYRVNADNQRIGGLAVVPEFTPGEGWATDGEYYYYTLPVAPGEKPAANLIGADGIMLASYSDADGGKQVIEVMAEAIQSVPATTVKESWGVTFNADGTITKQE